MTPNTPQKEKYRPKCPKCGSYNVIENTAYYWFMECQKCGWATHEYK